MVEISKNTDIAPLTTFGIHAEAAAVASYDSVDDLKTILAQIGNTLPSPFKVIGSGSNLLFTGDFPGTLIRCTNRAWHLSEAYNGNVTLHAAAGCVMDDLCLLTAREGLWGLENLSGIPGEAGASVVQNVGAYGVEAADRIIEARAYDTATGTLVRFSNAEMRFGYRHSRFKEPDEKGRYIILEVLYNLTTTPRPVLGYANLRSMLPGGDDGVTPMDVRKAVIAMRDAKLPDPSKTGSAGSFFKNPVVTRTHFDRISDGNPGIDIPHYDLPDGSVKIPAAWLIDVTGWKGYLQGGAAVWEKQPLVLANIGGTATADDVITLENKITESVNRRFGIRLSPEVEHI